MKSVKKMLLNKIREVKDDRILWIIWDFVSKLVK